MRAASGAQCCLTEAVPERRKMSHLDAIKLAGAAVYGVALLALFAVALIESHGSHVPRWDGVAIFVLFWGGVIGTVVVRRRRRRHPSE
jgi:hypothetical protein